MDQWFKLVAEVGFPIAAACAGGIEGQSQINVGGADYWCIDAMQHARKELVTPLSRKSGMNWAMFEKFYFEVPPFA